MDEKTLPILFANHVIRRLVNNLCGDDMIITMQDYTALRTTYRWCRGSWEAIVKGDVIHMRLLTNIVLAWGRMPERNRQTEFG